MQDGEEKNVSLPLFIYILGWPKSSFGFVSKMVQKPERTFWPTQYILYNTVHTLYTIYVNILYNTITHILYFLKDFFAF